MPPNNPNSIQDQVESLRIAREEMELTLEVMNQDWSKTNSSITSVMQKSAKILKVERDIAAARKLAAKHQAEYDRLMAQSLRTGQRLTTEEQKHADASKELAESTMKKLNADQKSVDALKSQLSLTKGIMGSVGALVVGAGLKLWEQVRDMPGFLNDADKAIRQLNLSLGNSGAAAERMQDNFIASGQYAAKFGMTVKDLTEMQGRFAELTGKANGMSLEQSKWMVRIAKGTGLGAEGAAEMAANMSLMGVNAANVGRDVENIVNEAAAMGINATNVLKDMNGSFARSQEFTFVRGRAGLKDMALNAQKMKISMESTFAAADKARTLKGSLDMASQLMVLGGNFAKADPFQLSFLARNDPAKFQKSIAEMTKGMASFNKATGEMSVSAYDMDRLRAVSEATNIPLTELKNSAEAMAKMSAAKNSLFVGTADDREMIAQMATMGKDGSFSVNVGGADVALSKLSTGQIALLKSEKSTLEARARDSQAFDELFKNTMMELKATALPFLKEMSSMLKSVKGFIDGMSPTTVKMVAMGGAILGAVTALGVAVYPLLAGIKGLMSLKGLFSGGGGGGGKGGFFSRLLGGGKNVSPSVAPVGPSNGPGPKLGGIGSSTAATLAAVGVAAVGMGYGIKLATEGISKLAEAMKGMTGPEVAGLVGVVAALSLGFVGMAFGVASFANPASLAGVAVVAGLAVAMVGMGFAIKLATDGVANMFTSMSSLAGLDLANVGGFFSTASNFLAADSSNFNGLMATVAYLKSAQTNMIAEMRDVMSQPITLQLAGDNKMVVHVEVVNNIDGDKFTKKFTKPFAVELQKATKGLRSLVG